jgi:hypothetical protein
MSWLFTSPPFCYSQVWLGQGEKQPLELGLVDPA